MTTLEIPPRGPSQPFFPQNGTQLGGGYLNEVYLRDPHSIVKKYHDEIPVGIPYDQRMRRERLALAHFAGRVAPAFLGLADIYMHQTFLPGKTYRDIMKEDPTNTNCFSEAGSLLRRIHEPVHRPFEYLQEELEWKNKKYMEKAGDVIRHFVPGFQEIKFDWDVISKYGSTRVHRDFWFGNIINGKAIDWEFSGIGSPFEDFAVAELWIFQQYGGSDDFYKAYGTVPEAHVVKSFLQLKCIQFLANTTVKDVLQEDPQGERFFNNIINVLKGGKYENSE